MSDFIVNTCGGSLHNVAEMAYVMREKLSLSAFVKGGEVEISIYMSSEFWNRCMCTVRGRVPSFELEFYDSYCNPPEKQTLLGNPVYVVDGGSHPDCVIYGRLTSELPKPIDSTKGGDKFDG